MKRLFSILAALVLVIAIMPFVIADGAEIGEGVDIDVAEDCVPPVIYVDPTARLWNPNDQTFYTAEEYGELIANVYNSSAVELTGYNVPARQNYAFTGETLTYMVAVYDEDGEDDIDEVNLRVDGNLVGSCMQIDDADMLANPGVDTDYINNHFNIPYDVDDDLYGNGIANPDTQELFAFYACTLIVQNVWIDELEVSVQVTDGDLDVCAATPNTVESRWNDLMNFNPELALDVTGDIDFGTVEPGSEAISTTMYLLNDAEDGSGVVMDMYIASDDYFTDPTTPDAICPTGNGIRFYDEGADGVFGTDDDTGFKYYATKGSINSGNNNAEFEGLGAGDGTGGPSVPGNDCESLVDEYTPLTSHSGHIEDMCRIINYLEQGSLLGQGSEMSITFKMTVPEPCEGHFTDGSFRFMGRVV